MTIRSLIALLFGFLIASCNSPELEPAPAPEAPSRFESNGPHPIGNASLDLTDTTRSRGLRVEIWYPAAESARAAAEAGQPVEDFYPEGATRTALLGLLKNAHEPGTQRRTHSAFNATPAGGQFPVVLFSHCYNCMRFSTFSIAERLASLGFAVVAPDHTGGTWMDDIEGDDASLGEDFLHVRAGDIRFVLDQVLDAKNASLPENLRGRFDASKIGVYGHSFGGVTAGLVLNEDSRVKAGMALAVPMENPLLPGVTLADIKVPLFFLLAQEDNSIYEFGNDYIRSNFDKANAPVWKAEVKDAGHFSFTDVCGIKESFSPGCGDDSRQTDPGKRFTYLDITTARGIAQAYAGAFFEYSLLGNADGLAYLNRAHPKEWVDLQSRGE